MPDDERLACRGRTHLPPPDGGGPPSRFQGKEAAAAEGGLPAGRGETTSSVSASRRCHLLRGCRPASAENSPLGCFPGATAPRGEGAVSPVSPPGETGAERQWGCSASPHPTHLRMRKHRTIHGRPKSAKVRCLCLAAQHTHFTQDYAIRFTPRVTENLGVRGDRSHFRVPPAGFSLHFSPGRKVEPRKEPTCI